MALYYFHIDDGRSPRDIEGTELESLTEAKCEAVKMAGTMICDAAGEFWDRAEWNMTVTNEDGLTMFALHFMGTESPASQIWNRAAPDQAEGMRRDESSILVPL